MNLYEKLEATVEIKGKIYEVNLAFDNVLKLLYFLENSKASDGERLIQGLNLLLGESLPLKPDEQLIVYKSIMDNFIHNQDKTEIEVDLQGNPMPVKKVKKKVEKS